MEDAKLDISRQVSYWQRCLKSLLPTEYTSTDSSRVMLGFFILSALDLLGAGAETLPASDIKAFKKWILGCQHPNGGFCGSPNHRYPDRLYAESHGRDVDPANLPATFFALLSLNFVGSISEVKRAKCLRWLKKLQREDGSFGEFLGRDNKVDGGSDMRYCHFAAGVRWILRSDKGAPDKDSFEDIDVDALVRHIRSGETYEGGIGESSEHESHAGYTYCAIASLSFLDRLPDSKAKSSFTAEAGRVVSSKGGIGFENLSGMVRWLLSRQLAYSDQDNEDDDHASDSIHDQPNIASDQQPSDPELFSLANLSLDDPHFVGFNGRANKRADTCYCFWVSASLEILGRGKLVNRESTRRFLLDQTQHRIGGFGKQPGYPPDLYHSYLGLATLAMMKEPALKAIDPVLCVSVQAKEKMQNEIEKSLIPTNWYWKHGSLFPSSEADPDHAEKIAGDEGPPQHVKDSLKGSNWKNGTKEVASAAAANI